MSLPFESAINDTAPNGISFDAEALVPDWDIFAREWAVSQTSGPSNAGWSNFNENCAPPLHQHDLYPVIHKSAYAPPNDYACNIMTGVPGSDVQNPLRAPTTPLNVMPTSASICPSSQGPPVASDPAGDATSSTKRFQCTVCNKKFERRGRANACKDKHDGVRPYKCRGECGESNCEAAYFRKDDLTRHCRSVDARKETCDLCGKSILRQNMARHKKKMPSCSGRRVIKVNTGD